MSVSATSSAAPTPPTATRIGPVELNDMQQNIETIAKEFGVVSFYKAPEDPLTEVFGNFFVFPFIFNEKTYQCSEAAFQAQKFAHDPERSDIVDKFTTVDGHGAWKLANKEHKAQVDPSWRTKSLEVMKAVVLAKFSHPDLKPLLVQATGSAYLNEHIPVKGRDAFYGDDNDGTGLNHLGRILMEVRGELSGTGVVEKPANFDPSARDPLTLRCSNTAKRWCVVQ